MGRKPNPFPVPKLSRRVDSWRIRWFHKGSLFEITLGGTEKAKAQALFSLASVALAGRDEWPEELATHPTVRRFLAHATGSTALAIPQTAAEITDAYYRHQSSKLASDWPKTARSHIRRFFEFVGSPDAISTRTVMQYIEAMADAPNRRSAAKNANDQAETKHIKNATRNRARSSLSGLFSWMRKTGMRPKSWNPIEGVDLLREERPADGIIVWEGTEVTALLKAASGLRDGIAIWIGILAGLRRGEIARLQWDDITETVINVHKSKTGRKRQVPLSAKLAERLAKEKRKMTDDKQERLRVVPWPEKPNGWMAAARDVTEVHLPRRLKSIHAKHPEKFGWNPFRHTFASRLAQAGHSLDLIAAWLGDSPKVCRDHYARFVPKNRRDTRIDDVDPVIRQRTKKPRPQ